MFRRHCGCNQGSMENDCERQGTMNPVIEPMVNNCIEKDYYCEVPHVCLFMQDHNK